MGEKLWLRKTTGLDVGLLVQEPDDVHPSPGSWVSVRAWLDADDRHVWAAHDCTDGREVTMLPWPTWQALPDGEVRPSFSCDRCGVHVSMEIGYAAAPVSAGLDDPR